MLNFESNKRQIKTFERCWIIIFFSEKIAIHMAKGFSLAFMVANDHKYLFLAGVFLSSTGLLGR